MEVENRIYKIWDYVFDLEESFLKKKIKNVLVKEG